MGAMSHDQNSSSEHDPWRPPASQPSASAGNSAQNEWNSDHTEVRPGIGGLSVGSAQSATPGWEDTGWQPQASQYQASQYQQGPAGQSSASHQGGASQGSAQPPASASSASWQGWENTGPVQGGQQQASWENTGSVQGGQQNTWTDQSGQQWQSQPQGQPQSQNQGGNNPSHHSQQNQNYGQSPATQQWNNGFTDASRNDHDRRQNSNDQGGVGGFFKNLFDISFNRFVSPSIIKILYILSIAMVVLNWVGGFIMWFVMAAAMGSYNSDDGVPFTVMGFLTLFFGWIPGLFAIGLLRVSFEFMLASVRTSEDVHVLRERSDAQQDR